MDTENSNGERAQPRPYLSTVSQVVVTGGSSGIGRAFLEALGQELPEASFLNLSRSEPENLTSLENRLRHTSVNLAEPEGRKEAVSALRAFAQADQSGRPLLLINNAGFGAYGPFPEADASRVEAMISVNIVGLLGLTADLLTYRESRSVAVVNIASTASFQPIPGMSTYAATKAFVLHWSLALAQENRSDPGTRVLCVCPGPTHTNFFEAAGMQRSENESLKIPFSQTAEAVVADSLRALEKGRSLVVTGPSNRFTAFLSSITPRRLSARLAGWVLKRLRLDRFR